ncbi:MAG: FMN-binding protein [Erysipelotrichaceae bacterium]|nr:FMN-binding protein [Erysipelotrichaceae bacterium]
MKKIAYLTCFLAIVCAVAGGALTMVNNMTAPIIDSMAIEAEKANLELIYPGAEFAEVENTDDTGLILGIYEASGKGYVYKLQNTGYASTPYQFLIAFNMDGTVGGYKMLSSNETSGFGARAWEADYTNSILALTSSDAFPLLSGATVTTTGVVEAIDAAKAHFNGLQGIEYDENAVAEAPALATGNPVALNSDLSAYNATIENEAADGDMVTYTVKVGGYGLVAPEASASGHEYQENIFEIVVNKADGTIDSMSMTQFGDTQGIGDKADTAEYYDLFKGATIDSSVDTVTSATYTSTSAIAAAQAALNAAAGQ